MIAEVVYKIWIAHIITIILKSYWQHGILQFFLLFIPISNSILVHPQDGISRLHRADDVIFCPTCIVHLNGMVCEIKCKGSFCNCFMGCCFKDLFQTEHSMLYSHNHDQLYKHICMYIYTCMQNHNNDTIKTTSDTVFYRNIPLTLFERVVCERELETEQNWNILTSPLLWPSVFLSRSPGLLNRRPGGPGFCRVLAFSTPSCLQTLWSPN